MAFFGRMLARNVSCMFQRAKLESRNLIHTNARLLAARIQEPAPNFKGVAVVDGDFREIQLSDYRGKYLVLFFYPLDFTFVCPTEIIAFSENIDEFRKIGAEVVGASVDSQFSHLAWTNTARKNGGLGKLNYPLLADITKQISRDYGVLLEKEGIAFRGTFIIDPNGILRQYSINDLPVGRSISECLRLIKAFQFVDEHGEVCPANWDPKQNPDTIKPSVDKSKEYFNKHG